MLVRRWMVGCGAGMVLAACGGGSGGGNPLQPPPGPALPADTVSIVDNSFGPQTVKVSQGGTVTWIWSGMNPHNVRWAAGPTLPPGSATQATGTPYDVTFSQVGTYEYVCSVHQGMQGAVFVE